MPQQIRMSLSDSTYKLLKKHAKENVRTISQEIEYQLKQAYRTTTTAPHIPHITHTPSHITPAPVLTQPQTQSIQPQTPAPGMEPQPQSTQPASTPTSTPTPTPEPLGTVLTTVTDPSITDPDRDNEVEIEVPFYTKDKIIIYELPLHVHIKPYHQAVLLEDIKTQLKSHYPEIYPPVPAIISIRELQMIKHIHDTFPKHRIQTLPDTLLWIHTNEDTPEALTIDYERQLHTYIINDMKHTRRPFSQVVDLLTNVYPEVYSLYK